MVLDVSGEGALPNDPYAVRLDRRRGHELLPDAHPHGIGSTSPGVTHSPGDFFEDEPQRAPFDPNVND